MDQIRMKRNEKNMQDKTYCSTSVSEGSYCFLVLTYKPTAQNADEMLVKKVDYAGEEYTGKFTLLYSR